MWLRVDELRDAVVLADPVHQLVGVLHDVFAGGPLAGVVHAELHERRLAVDDVHVLADLQAEDRAPLQALVGQHHELDQPRVGQCEGLHLGLVVGEVPVVGAPARQRAARRARPEGPRDGCVGAPALDEVGDERPWHEPGAAQPRLLLGRVQDELQASVAAVLGQVEAERVEPPCGGGPSRGDLHEPRGVRLVLRADVGRRHGQPRRTRSAVAAAGLDEQLTTGERESLGELGRHRATQTRRRAARFHGRTRRGPSHRDRPSGVRSAGPGRASGPCA